jgi:hypothetical protein
MRTACRHLSGLAAKAFAPGKLLPKQLATGGPSHKFTKFVRRSGLIGQLRQAEQANIGSARYLGGMASVRPTFLFCTGAAGVKKWGQSPSLPEWREPPALCLPVDLPTCTNEFLCLLP